MVEIEKPLLNFNSSRDKARRPVMSMKSRILSLLIALSLSRCICEEQVLISLGPPRLTLSATELDFGKVPVGSTVKRGLVLLNSGEQTLQIESAAFTGVDGALFGGAQTPLTIEPGAEIVWRLSFVPEAERPHAAALVIESDADNGAVKEVGLRGTGVQASACGSCDTPPSAECLSEYSRLSWSRSGTCVNDECRYEAQVEECAQGCDEAMANCVGAVVDAGVADTAPPDVQAPDTTTPDSDVPDNAVIDTLPPDATAPDVLTPDMAVPDTRLPDTATADRGLVDTWLPDTATADRGLVDTSMPTCPMATGSWSASYTGLRYGEGRWAVWAGGEVFTWGSRGDLLDERPPAMLDPASGVWTELGYPAGVSSLEHCLGAYTAASDTVSLFCSRLGYRFKVANRTWQPMTSSRYLRASAPQLLQVANDKIFLYDTASWRASFYDPEADLFTSIDGSNGPEANCCAGAASDGSSIYLWGGVFLGGSNRGWKLDLGQLHWSPLPGTDILPTMSGAVVFWVAGSLVVANAFESFRFDGATQTWTELATHPTRMDYTIGCHTYDDRAFCLHVTEQGSIANLYDAEMRAWSAVPMGGVHFHRSAFAVARTPAQLIVIGGIPYGNAPESIHRGQVLALDPVSLAWQSDQQPLLPPPAFSYGSSPFETASATYLPGVDKVTLLNLSWYGNNAALLEPASGQWSAIDPNNLNLGNPGTHHAMAFGDRLWLLTDPDMRLPVQVYNPGADTWSSGPALPLEEARDCTYAVSLGDRVFFLHSATARAAVYGPGNMWNIASTEGAPSARQYTTLAALGTTRVAVWGGYRFDPISYLGDGAIYDLDLDTWTPMSADGAPDAREGHAMVWTGAELLVWGGGDSTGTKASGAAFDPDSDTWRPMTTLFGPALRDPVAAWTGSHALLIGTQSQDASAARNGTGGLYDPDLDQWQCLPLAGAPPISAGKGRPPVGAWTGDALVMIPGGGNRSAPVGAMGIYRP